MNGLEKKRQLEKIIYDEVLPLIDRDYVLYGLPYYDNIGDILIWDGEIELLKKSKYKCRGVCAWNEYPKTKLSQDILIIITGGGYFGDLWREAWNSVLEGIKNNKENKIIFMPNSIFYENEELRASDAKYLEQFTKLSILVRDKASYDYALKYFKNEVKLVPDMAFCMNESLIIRGIKKPANKKILYLSRQDKERSTSAVQILETDYDNSDWITIQKNMAASYRFRRLLSYASKTRRISNKIKLKIEHFLYRLFFRRFMTQYGINQLSDYEKIISTRLHGMILGLMLERNIKFIDNSYGKRDRSIPKRENY